MGLKNFLILSAHKIMPPAMEAIADEDVGINGYICPGHVSTITGVGIYEDLPAKYGLGCVISGFEPADILQSIFMLMKQVNNRKPVVEIQYRRAVKPGGNKKAKQYMAEVFQERDDRWRGLGIIKNSGLGLKQEFKEFDADFRYPIKIGIPTDDLGCICGEILQGKKRPVDCQLFAKQCTPSNPIGACMVSGEGACQAYFKYKAYG
jgi:hydrogenase expression/formation protein HypD